MSETELFAETPGRLGIDIWADVMCPFCYLGDTRLEKAIQQFEHGPQVDVRYHSFLLMPELDDQPTDLADLLSTAHGMPRERAIALNDGLAGQGRELGLDLRFDIAQAVNTTAAHRLIHFAAANGKQRAMVRRLFKAYFTDGLNIADQQTLVDLAADAGLDPGAAADSLQSEDLSAEVDLDLRYARELEITAVPFFVLGGKYAISGAQPVEVFAEALRTAWDEVVDPAG